MLKTILFDYGGTLDTAARHWSYVLWDGYRAAGVTLSEADFRRAYVHGERTLARERHILPEDDFRTLLFKKVAIEIDFLLKEQLLTPADAARAGQLVEEITDYCDRYAARETQRSLQVLERLAARYKLVMVSNFYGNLHAVLQRYGLLHLFADVVESAVVGVRKPDAAIWRLGVEAAGCSPAECVAVGDSYGKDIVPAKEIGCETVWFKGEEWETKERDETLPDHVIDNLEELCALYL